MTDLSAEEWAAAFEQAERSMLHLELRRSYASGGEHFRAWLAGDETPLQDRWELFADWIEMIARQTSRGVRVERARVIDDPPTDYQRWETWCAPSNIEAGERVWTVGRATALAVGLDPGRDGLDWWLFDDSRLMLMAYDSAGEMTRAWLTTDRAELEAARHQWRLSVSHGEAEHPAHLIR